MKKIEFDQMCSSCEGTGIYTGMAEHDGAGVVCYNCEGTGCYHFVHEYEPFVRKAKRDDVKRVFATNPGIGVGVSKERDLELEDFGGMPYEDWFNQKPFPKESEMRKFTCPAWWYQSADYKKKPDWKKCILIGSFLSCKHFEQKHICWKQWDKEQEEKK